jgi:glycosyltransferase involved in cell wall biosynthesis
MNKNLLPDVSIVVIGKNEGNHLEDTFSAILNIDYPQNKLELIYVDANSKDNSISIAEKYCQKVIGLKSNWASSGLARNHGLIKARHEIVHFIDGDTSISDQYLKRAVEKINNQEIYAVTGYFKEKYPDKFFNRIMDFRRDEVLHTESFCESTNGGGTYLKSRLLSVNGYDERILKGQESELGIRYREKGYKILFIDEVQGLHNFDLNSVWGFIKFKFLYGKSGGYLLKVREDLNNYIIQSIQSAKKVLLANTFSLIVITITIILKQWYILPGYYLIRIIYLFVKNKTLKKKSNRQLLHSFIQYIFSFSTFFGIITVLVNPKLKPAGKEILQS